MPKAGEKAPDDMAPESPEEVMAPATPPVGEENRETSETPEPEATTAESAEAAASPAEAQSDAAPESDATENP
jgi:hypothetical protein